eukprot:g76787.t1
MSVSAFFASQLRWTQTPAHFFVVPSLPIFVFNQMEEHRFRNVQGNESTEGQDFNCVMLSQFTLWRKVVWYRCSLRLLLTAQFETRATVPAGTILLSVLSLSGFL